MNNIKKPEVQYINLTKLK